MRLSRWADTVYGITSPAELIKERRLAHRLSQRELAYRAGTSQSAIARVESGDEEITWARLKTILSAMGDEPVLSVKRLTSRYDVQDLMYDRALPAGVRLATGLSANRFASEMAIAGARAKQRAKSVGA